MKNLDAINPQILRPEKFTSFAGAVSAVIGLICLPLAWGAAPDISFANNPVIGFLFSVVGVSLFISFISVVCKWGWEVRFFGFSMLLLSSVSLIALVPLLTVLLFGTLSVKVNSAIIALYMFSHVWWCRKFVIIYRDVFNNCRLRAILYEEDVDVVYYKRKGDNFLLKTEYEFSQMPPNRYFIAFIFLGLMLVPAIGDVQRTAGVPFAHVFLTVAMLPISWMSIGLAVRGFLIYYYYPRKIKSTTGKDVYVDLAGKVNISGVA